MMMIDDWFEPYLSDRSCNQSFMFILRRIVLLGMSNLMSEKLLIRIDLLRVIPAL